MDADVIEHENSLLKIREDINLLKELVHGTRQSVLFSYDRDLMKREFERNSFAKMKEILDSSEKNIRHVLLGYSKDATSNFDEGNENSISAAHPFTKNNVVLTVIFGFLNLESIKNCRLVNKTWKETSQLFFVKKVELTFTSEMDHDKFFDDFDDNNRWDCGQYKFSNMSLSLSEANRIFSRDFSTLTSLTLIDVALESEDDLEITDLNGLLGDIKLKKLVVSNYHTSDKNIKFEKLSSVEHLELRRCKVVLNKETSVETRCCPKYIKLRHVSFETPAGENISESLANNLFDFSKASKIIIHYVDPDLQLNLESTTHKLETVDLRGIELVLTKRLQITNLKFDFDDDDLNDLSSLPDSLENLEFNEPLTNVVQSDTVNPFLPNLKGLCISALELESPIKYLNKFSNCSKLKFVKLEKNENDFYNRNSLTDCDLSWLPQSVETLQLKDVSGIPEVATFRHLKNLAIRRCKWPLTLYMRPNFLVDNLYISFEYGTNWTATGALGQSAICRKMLKDRAFRKKFIVEGFNWKNKRQFKKDPLSQIVDKMSICYSFEGDRGRAVSFIPPKRSPYDIKQNNMELENKYFQRYIMEETMKY